MSERLQSISSFIKKIPKTNLHIHIEGTIEPKQMFEFASRNKVVDLPYHNVDQVEKAFQFTGLQSFLDIYYKATTVIITEVDFYELTYAYFTKIHPENVCHIEIFFDPQAHTERGIAFETVINGIYRAMEDAEKNFKITSKLIMCF